MKITKTNKIAGYRCEIRLKTSTGMTIKYFSSTSGVDHAQADQNCYKRIVYFCRRALRYFDDQKNYWIDDHIAKIIKVEKLHKKDFQKIIDKIEPMIIRIKSTEETIDL